MNELLHVIQREYLTRVRTILFVLITLLTPFILLSVVLLPTFFVAKQKDYKQLNIGLIDPTNSFNAAFDGSDLSVEYLNEKTKEDTKSLILTKKWEGIVYVEKSDPTGTNIQYYSKKSPSVFLLNQIKFAIQRVVINDRLADFGIENLEGLIYSTANSVVIESFKVVNTETIETSSNLYKQVLCIVLGSLIYIFVFLYASQVMRSVMEEKSSRIVELIITSISPTKFMAGKIIAIGLLGLTQIICWIAIIYGVTLLSYRFLGTSTACFENLHISFDTINQILSNLNLIDFSTIIPAFIFFFIGGYLLYSSVFAAIAAAANHNDDIQQTMLIVTIPLILSILVLSNTMISPDSSLSYWFSIIPFTSPVVMVGRIVRGAPIWDILLSMLLLVSTVAGTIALSGKVYRTAILYTGKKVTLKDVIGWIRISNK